MKLHFVTGLLITSLMMGSMPLSNAAVTPGSKCPKSGLKQTYKGKTYTCIKLGKRLYWNNGTRVVISKPTPMPTPIPTPTPTPSPTPTPMPQPCVASVNSFKVGLAYDIGGRGDKSFNDLAAVGLDEAIRKLCISTQEETLTIGSDSERDNKLRLLAKAGFNPIIAVGFLYATSLAKVAADYPKIQFGIIDDASIDLPNVAGLVFAEHEGSYLAGVAAALASKSGKIGFIGGVRIPLLQKFEAGFVAGVKATRPEFTVDVRYVSEPPDWSGFNDPAKAKVIAKGMIDKGIDVMYSAAGGSGAGNFAAATDAAKAGKKVWTIGADTDQWQTASADEKMNMLTSVVKRIDVAVYGAISTLNSGGSLNERLDPKTRSFGRTYGVVQGGLTLARSGGFIEGFMAEISKAENGIKSGQIIVPSKP